MQQEIPHYGDIFKRVEKMIRSCTTIDQLNSARRYADLFATHCERASVAEQSRFVMMATVNNRLEDQLEDLKLEQLNGFEQNNSTLNGTV